MQKEHGDLYDILDAYEYIYKAQQLGTNIVSINISLGALAIVGDEDIETYCNVLKTIIDLVGENGAVSVIAAGNSGYKLDENGECTVEYNVEYMYIELEVGQSITVETDDIVELVKIYNSSDNNATDYINIDENWKVTGKEEGVAKILYYFEWTKDEKTYGAEMYIYLNVINNTSENNTEVINIIASYDEENSGCDIYSDYEDITLEYADTYVVNYIEFPAGIDSDYIIAVGAVNGNGELASFSNYGDCVDIVAPGTNILSTILTNDKNDEYFNPTLLTDEEIEDNFAVAVDFTSESEISENNIEIYGTEEYLYYDLNVSSSEIEVKNNNFGKISIENDNFYGDDGSSLKWTFTCTEEDLLKDSYGVYFTIKTNIDDSSRFISISYHVESDEGGLFYSNGFTFTCNDGSSRILLGGLGFYSSTNYWMTQNSYLYSEIFQIPFEECGGWDGGMMLGCTPFVAGTYTLYIDNLYISNENATDDGIWWSGGKSYAYFDGTSMAAPYVTAAVAVASNLYEDKTALELKEILLSSTTNDEELSGKVTTGILNISNMKNIITSNKYTVSNSGLYIKNVPVGTTTEEFKEYIITELNYEVKDKDGNSLESTDKVATGYMIVTENGDKYLIAVLGDVTGDRQL